MPRGLDPTMAAALANGTIAPVVLAELTFRSGVSRAWSGIGDLVWNGKTFSGVGALGAIGPITENSTVMAEGTTVTLLQPAQTQIGFVTPSTPSPPFTPPAGQSVAWAFPTRVVAGPAQPATNGSASATTSSGAIAFTLGTPLGNNYWGINWSGFTMPPQIPPGSQITGVYAVLQANAPSTAVGAGAAAQAYAGVNESIWDFVPAGSPQFLTQNTDNSVTNAAYSSASLGTTLTNVAVGARLGRSTSGACTQILDVTFVGIAVYYVGSPLTARTVLQEALTDAAPGGPAKIWFGLWSTASGGFIGTPFLSFSGLMDESTVQEDPSGTKIVLALENRLRNLQRASRRRYTAADQKLSYPADSGFNWVEILQEISLIWGS